MSFHVIKTGWGLGQVVDMETGIVRYFGRIDRCNRWCDMLNYRDGVWMVTTHHGHVFEVKADRSADAKREAQLHIWREFRIADHPIHIEKLFHNAMGAE